MSNWFRAVLAANKAVRAPKILIIGKAQETLFSRGWHRNKRNTPATTIVELWRRADTGVGPSMAEGSQGWSENWADFPAAAIIIPRRAQKVKGDWLVFANKFFRSQEFRKIILKARKTIIPLSPIRLYIIACRAALLASARVNHQPIRIKESIPTPSQPINNKNKLLADTKINIKKRKNIKVLKNAWFFGSLSI